MSTLYDEYLRTAEELKRPTLKLLRQKEAPVILAVLSEVFGDRYEPIAINVVHNKVRLCLQELQTIAADEVAVSILGERPDSEIDAAAGQPVELSDAVEMTQRWRARKWLVRDAGSDGETYTLTSGAQEARALVQRSAAGTTVSASRIAAIMSTARNTVEAMSEDREARIASLDAQISKLQQEREALVSGADVAVATDDEVVQAIRNISDMVSRLPADFKRVAEILADAQRAALIEMKTSNQPKGVVIKEAFDTYENLLHKSDEGRAFDGASQLLSSHSTLVAVSDDLQTLTRHPAAASLQRTEVQRVTSAMRTIREGVDAVQTQRADLAANMRKQIDQFDYGRDRTLDRLLKTIERGMRAWSEDTGPNAALGWRPDFAEAHVVRLKQRYWEAGDDMPPEPVDFLSPEDDAAPTARELRMRSGPSRAQLADAIVDLATSGEDDAPTPGSVLSRLPDELRRPVELGGMLDLAAQGGIAIADDSKHEVIETVRSTGERCWFSIPAITFDERSVDALYHRYVHTDPSQEDNEP